MGDEADLSLAAQADLVRRFSHGLATHTIRTNWACWLLTRLGFSEYASIEEAELLLKSSECAYCHQIASTFVWIMRQRGVAARLVQLNGHVVAEARVDGEWHIFDPDYGVPADRLAPSVDALYRNPDLVMSTYGGNRLARDPATLTDVFAGTEPRYFAVGELSSVGLAKRQRRALRTANGLVALAAGAALLHILKK